MKISSSILLLPTLLSPFFAQAQETIKLSNGVEISSIGLGVGNLQHDLIPTVLSEQVVGIKGEKLYDLIDTGAASKNEKIISDSLSLSKSGGEVITKVWYTHLGYERTKFAVQNSLKELSPTSVKKVHLMIHWPYCRDEIEWMNCEQEEKELTDRRITRYESPLKNKTGKNAAWKGSWKALEEMYTENPRIASIGVSNFEIEEMNELLQMATVKPHIYQGSVWALFNAPELINLLNENGITFQTFGVMSTIFNNLRDFPNARYHLERIALDLTRQMPEGEYGVTWPRLILKWISQAFNGKVGVVTRTSSLEHANENNPKSIAKVPNLSPVQLVEVEEVLASVLNGQDTPDVDELMKDAPLKVRFVNRLPAGRKIDVFWVHPESKEHTLVSEGIESDHMSEIDAYVGHSFFAVASDGSIFDFMVNRNHFHDGKQAEFIIGGRDGEL